MCGVSLRRCQTTIAYKYGDGLSESQHEQGKATDAWQRREVGQNACNHVNLTARVVTWITFVSAKDTLERWRHHETLVLRGPYTWVLKVDVNEFS